jgi:hypothetical protein
MEQLLKLVSIAFGLMGFIVLGTASLGIFIYFIWKRLKDKEQETFEKRNN